MIAVIIDSGNMIGAARGVHLFRRRKEANAWAKEVLQRNGVDGWPVKTVDPKMPWRDQLSKWQAEMAMTPPTQIVKVTDHTKKTSKKAEGR